MTGIMSLMKIGHTYHHILREKNERDMFALFMDFIIISMNRTEPYNVCNHKKNS